MHVNYKIKIRSDPRLQAEPKTNQNKTPVFLILNQFFPPTFSFIVSANKKFFLTTLSMRICTIKIKKLELRFLQYLPSQ